MDHVLHQLLARSAERYAGRPAVVDRDRMLTYAELDDRSARLANLLASRGVRPGDRVGLYLDKSLESIVAIYAVLRAGAAYVPLDPDAPVARLAYIARDCGVRVLVTGAEKSEQWPELVAEAALETLVCLNGDDVAGPQAVELVRRTDVDTTAPLAGDVRRIDLDLAYILYTSGSTGTPKGVMLSHRNALTFVEWAVEEFAVGPDDRLSSHAPLHFDLSIFDVFAAAAAGAAVVLVPPQTSVFPIEVARFIERERISIWYSVPSILSMLTLRGKLREGDLPGLRTILFAGEVFPTKYLRTLMGRLPHVRFVNLYGPTETNVCTYYDVPVLPDDRTEPISIGRAISDVEVFALTEEGRVACPGEVGELYVRGSTVLQGYWGDPVRTAQTRVPDPRGGPDPVYRTGDLVRELPDGNLEFLGRRDAQIKSRGYRIELGDIESALYAHPQVVECAVTAVPDDVVTNRIKAFVVTRGALEPAELVRFCSDRIPRYMIPEIFEFRTLLPKTSTGKIDRQALVAAAG